MASFTCNFFFQHEAKVCVTFVQGRRQKKELIILLLWLLTLLFAKCFNPELKFACLIDDCP